MTARSHAKIGSSTSQRSTDVRRRLGRAIDHHRKEIEARWLERVQEDIVESHAVEVTQLRDGLPAYLLSIVALLEHDGEPVKPTSAQAWEQVAREHGVTRVRIGFDIGQLIHEFVVLRKVIRDAVASDGVSVDGAGTILTEILDAAIIAAVRSYVDARDHEARRRQAEHIGFLTHELRNPLSSAVLAASQLRLEATPEQKLPLEILERNHRRLSDLIDSVLLTEQLAFGGVEARRVALRLGQIVDAALESARATAAHKGLELVATYDPDLVVELDPLLTRSAVQNLVDNAVKYTDAGRVEVLFDDRSDALVIHVRDACGGIAETEVKTIFETFRRGTTGKSGTGLGLAIAKRATEAQGGLLEVESRGPFGCHFWMTLPKSRPTGGKTGNRWRASSS